MAKRGLLSTAGESSSKKPKSSLRSSSLPKPAAPAPSLLETVQSTVQSVVKKVTGAVELAGEIVLDDEETPISAEVVQASIDVPRLKKKGKQAAEALSEQAAVVMEAAKPLKGKAARAAADAQETGGGSGGGKD